MPTKPTGKPRGRPPLKMPEPIPDSPENVAGALFAVPVDHKWKFLEEDKQTKPRAKSVREQSS